MRQFFAMTLPQHFAMIGLVLFVILFVVLILWTFRRGSAGKYRVMADLPLEAEDRYDI